MISAGPRLADALAAPKVAKSFKNSLERVGQVANLRADCQSAQTARVSNPRAASAQRSRFALFR